MIDIIQKRASYFDSIGKSEIQQLLEQINPILAARRRKHQRCWRKLAPHEDMSAIVSGNVMVPFEHYIVNMAKGYLAGKPPVYTFSKDRESYELAIADIKTHNDDATTFATLMEDFIVTSASYAYILESENNRIEYKRIDPLNTAVVYNYDIEPKPIAVVRILEIENETQIEITTAESRRMFDISGNQMAFDDFAEDGTEKEVMEKKLFWNEVPIAAFEHPQMVSVFDAGVDLISMFENMLTNKRSMTQYNDEAKLVIKGHQTVNPPEKMDENGNVSINPMWVEEISRLYQAKALHFPVEGSAEWLIKNVDYQGMINTLADLKELIFMVTSVPNLADSHFAGNATGVALKYKMYALDQYVTTLDRIFKKGYHRLWGIITNRLNQRGNNYSIYDMGIDFAKNAPESSGESINEAVNLFKNGIVSQYSAIAHAEVGLDPAEEIERMAAELGALQTEDVL